MSFAVLYCSVHEMFPKKWTLKVGPIRTWVLKWNKQHLCLLENNCLYSFNCHMVAYKGLKWGKKKKGLVIESPNLRENSFPEHQKRMFVKWKQRREMSGWSSEWVGTVGRRMKLWIPRSATFPFSYCGWTFRCCSSFSSHKDSMKQE